MAIALNVAKNGIDRTRRKLRVTFNLTWSGNYVTGGDTLDFTKATDTNFAGYRVPFGPPEAIELTNCNPGGFDTEGVIGTKPSNCLLKVFVAGSGAATPQEHAAGAYEAGITGDLNTQITAIWGRGSN